MASKKKLLQAAAGSAGGGAITDIDEAFSTFLYEGTGAAQNIANGINLGNNIAGSVDFDGAGDSLESTSHSFAYGTGDFTVEFWMYPHSLSSQSVVFGARADASTGFMIGPNNSGEIRFYYNNAERIVDTGNALSINTWFHIAVTRASGTTKLFKNGTQVGSSYSDTNNYTSSVLEIGQRAISDGLAYDGLVSNVRVVLGTALYTSNFTPSTEPLTAISGTELLICTANNFVDEGPNNIVFTVKGDPQVSSSSPFTGNTGEGGLVWIKNRDSANGHNLEDTERGAGKTISSNTTDEEYNLTGTSGLSSFNSNGFSIIGSQNRTNTNGDSYAAWTFRKAPKFFDIVTYTGDGTTFRDIAHNLGSVPGHIIVKKTSGGSPTGWVNWHRTFSDYDNLFLSGTSAIYNDGSNNSLFGQASNMTSTHFELGGGGNISYINEDGSSYVAYLFAHNNGDGEFGPNQDQDIIKCGSFTTNGSGVASVNLGFETQWLMYKKSSGIGSWVMYDNMRGMAATGSNIGAILYANGSFATLSTTAGDAKATATGIDFNTGENNTTYIYMAIRRGPLAEPESATDVFHVNNYSGNSNSNLYNTGFNVDMNIHRKASNTSDTFNLARLIGSNNLYTNTTGSEDSNTPKFFEPSNVLNLKYNWWGTQNDIISWSWKRAPSYFDVVAYTGTGSGNLQISHNLNAVPEMMWVKIRSGATNDWVVYHKDLPTSGDSKKTLFLNLDSAGGYGNYFADASGVHVAPTSSVFTLGSEAAVNGSSSYNYIAYLFATVAGVSKVGSYTGTGSTGLNIDCGFSSGARFVMIKRTDAAPYDWLVWDSVRGIVSGDDKRLSLNTTNAEVTQDNIDPLSSGFTISTTINGVNQSGGSYIFYAIA